MIVKVACCIIDYQCLHQSGSALLIRVHCTSCSFPLKLQPTFH